MYTFSCPLQVLQLDDSRQRPTITSFETFAQSNIDTIPILKTSGFQWSGVMETVQSEESSSSNSSDEEGEGERKKNKKKKKKVIEYDQTGDMHTRRPESTDDFERVLLGSPNSSFLWIQYMSFQLQLSEIDKAREIGKRALQTINFREEGEKLNVWVALLNLENQFGTDETLDIVFKDAARANDSKTIHLRMAVIFDESGHHEVRVVFFFLVNHRFECTCTRLAHCRTVSKNL